MSVDTDRINPERLIDTWPDWDLGLKARPRLIEHIHSGRTNRNFRLSAPGLEQDLLLRVNHPAPGSLGIDRERERAILSLTADAGLTRPFLHWDPVGRFVIFPHLPGRAWTQTDLDDPRQRERLWPLIDRLHAIRPDWPRRDYHAYLNDYWYRLERAGLTDSALEDAWQNFEPRLQGFSRSNWPACLVHHDLVGGNILETDAGLYLIDWEYAAPGHADIDTWAIAPQAVGEPFIAEMMEWIIGLWERLIRAASPDGWLSGQ